MLYILEYRTQSDKLTLKSVTPRTLYVYQRVELVFMQLIMNSLKLSVKLSNRKSSSQTNQKVNSVMLTQLFKPVCNGANNELTDGHFGIWSSYHSMYAPCLGVNIDMWQCADVPFKIYSIIQVKRGNGSGFCSPGPTMKFLALLPWKPKMQCFVDFIDIRAQSYIIPYALIQVERIIVFGEYTLLKLTNAWKNVL